MLQSRQKGRGLPGTDGRDASAGVVSDILAKAGTERADASARESRRVWEEAKRRRTFSVVVFIRATR